MRVSDFALKLGGFKTNIGILSKEEAKKHMLEPATDAQKQKMKELGLEFIEDISVEQARWIIWHHERTKVRGAALKGVTKGKSKNAG